ncbi:MAG TPA: VOC family protein [Flavobacteriales bacterium]|nr:VOC family protein [Flavobacteriales bacterium]
MKEPIYPCLWFDGQAKAAADFYCSVFKDAKILSENPMVVQWEIGGRKFMGLNGGPQFKMNEAVSFVLECENQGEIDYYWEKFTTEGGKESMCGWCQDKYGVWWQVIPAVLGKLMSDPARSQRVVAAFMQMKKFDIETLMNA